MIEIKNLCRSFGTLRAVDDISFSINSGSITGFLGPNGAGKTTTLRMMVGYLKPDSGSILIDGVSIYVDPLETSARIGYLPESNPLYEDMPVIQMLKYVADLRRMSAKEFASRQESVISACGIANVLAQKISTLSKGYRQRVGLAVAILHDPDILILDEPTSGLDPNQIIEIRELIRKLGKEKTVILSSHIMQEVQALCDRVLIISKGKIIVDDDIENLNSYLQDYQLIQLELNGDNVDFELIKNLCPDLQISETQSTGNSHKLSLTVSTNIDIRHDLARLATEQGWLITGLYTEQRSLEEIFHKLTQEGEIPPINELVEEPVDMIDEVTDSDTEEETE